MEMLREHVKEKSDPVSRVRPGFSERIPFKQRSEELVGINQVKYLCLWGRGSCQGKGDSIFNSTAVDLIGPSGGSKRRPICLQPGRGEGIGSGVVREFGVVSSSWIVQGLTSGPFSFGEAGGGGTKK